MQKKELQKLPKAALIDIISSELGALDALIREQKEDINKLDSNPTRDLGAYYCATNRMGGYTVARDMLLRFISKHTKTEKEE